MQLNGFHHLTAITANAKQNLHFYTQVLGMRLVKKTVNQDDVSAYHLFYGDGVASPGSDITFFEWPVEREKRGSGSVTRTGFRVASTESLNFWETRFATFKMPFSPVTDVSGSPTLLFEDPEGQRLSLHVDALSSIYHPWLKSPVPAEHQLLGLGPITISVRRFGPTSHILTDIMGMSLARSYVSNNLEVQVFSMGSNTLDAELHVIDEKQAPLAVQGAGGVHHVAFRTPTSASYEQWVDHLAHSNIRNSGAIDRYYFQSLYFREPSGILFEIATDGPGFAVDEPLEKLGEAVSLPPFLEGRRAEIEQGLKPLNSSVTS